MFEDTHEIRLNQVTFPALNYEDSKSFYERLGLTLIVDAPPRYARFEFPPSSGGGEPATLSIHLVSADWKPCVGVLIYFEVRDVDAFLEAKELSPLSPPATQNYLWREADIEDPAGNKIRIFSAGEDRRFPPWRCAS